MMAAAAAAAAAPAQAVVAPFGAGGAGPAAAVGGTSPLVGRRAVHPAGVLLPWGRAAAASAAAVQGPAPGTHICTAAARATPLSTQLECRLTAARAVRAAELQLLLLLGAWVSWCWCQGGGRGTSCHGGVRSSWSGRAAPIACGCVLLCVCVERAEEQEAGLWVWAQSEANPASKV